jgi:hypothetical protein
MQMGQSVYELDGLAGRAMNRQSHQAKTAHDRARLHLPRTGYRDHHGMLYIDDLRTSG